MQKISLVSRGSRFRYHQNRRRNRGLTLVQDQQKSKLQIRNIFYTQKEEAKTEKSTMERNPGSTPSQNFSKTQLSSMPVPRAQTKYSKELVKFDKNEIQGYSSAMKKTSTLNFRYYNNNISRKCPLRPRRCLGSKSRPPVRC